MSLNAELLDKSKKSRQSKLNSSLNISTFDNDLNFIQAVLTNNPILLEQAINNGANIKTSISKGGKKYSIPDYNNPLLWSCMNGHLEAAECLLKYRATHTDAYGQTPLHWLTHYHDIPNAFEMIKLLVKYGVNVNALDRKGENALFWLVANNGPLDLAQFLIENGSYVDIQDPNGLTPLHMALNNENFLMVKLLLKQGKANPNLYDVYGQSPLNSGEFFIAGAGAILQKYNEKQLFNKNPIMKKDENVNNMNVSVSKENIKREY